MASINPEAISGGCDSRRQASNRTKAAIPNSRRAFATAARISEAKVAERAPAISGAAREPDREQRQSDASDVREHVTGIGQQGEAVGRQAADQLDDEHPKRHQEDHGESAAVGARCGHPVSAGHQRAASAASDRGRRVIYRMLRRGSPEPILVR